MAAEPNADLVERVARAIAISDGLDPDEMHEGSPIWLDREDNARAAIAAMPEAGRWSAKACRSQQQIINAMLPIAAPPPSAPNWLNCGRLCGKFADMQMKTKALVIMQQNITSASPAKHSHQGQSHD